MKNWKSKFLQIFNSYGKYISSYGQIISIPFRAASNCHHSQCTIRILMPILIGKFSKLAPHPLLWGSQHLWGRYTTIPFNHLFYILFFIVFYSIYGIFIFNVMYRYQHFWYQYLHINISSDINIIDIFDIFSITTTIASFNTSHEVGNLATTRVGL